MTRPAILVLASPVDQVSIAAALRARGTYEVVEPDLTDLDWRPTTPVDGIISAYAIDRDLEVLTVELPQRAQQPIRVRVHGLTVGVKVNSADPLDDAILVLDQFLLGTSLTPIAL